jgi:hypothetical protein
MVINYTDIHKMNNHLTPKESLNSDGHQLHWHQQNQQSPVSYSPFKREGHQLHQYLQSEQSPLS